LENKQDCQNQKINYKDFFQKLIKTSELLRQEKIWNIFKNFSDGNDEIANRSYIIEFLDIKGIKYSHETFNKYFPNNETIKYKKLLAFFDEEKIYTD